MAKIENKNYRNFIDNGIIETLEAADIKKALDNVRGRHIKEARSLIIALYYTGARPNEVLRLMAKDLVKKDSYLIVKLKGSKGGLPRPVYLPLRLEMVKELYKYSRGLFEGMFLFSSFKNEYKRTYIKKNGDIIEYVEISGKLRYYFNIWFNNVVKGSIPPYFLRHNRLSKLAGAGLSLEDLRQLKGSKTFDSVYPYLHLSTKSAKKIARSMD